MQKKTLTIIAIITLFVIIVIIGTFLAVDRDPAENLYTGGSLETTEGYLSLRGYSTPTNDAERIPLSKFLSLDQQINIRSHLEAILFNRYPQSEYTGNVLPGSVGGDYRASTLTFRVGIENPEVIYTVRYNTVTDEIAILDDNNQPVNPLAE